MWRCVGPHLVRDRLEMPMLPKALGPSTSPGVEERGGVARLVWWPSDPSFSPARAAAEVVHSDRPSPARDCPYIAEDRHPNPPP